MNKPLFQNTTIAALDTASIPDERPRGHLGMSQIGNPDKREVWLSFRWSLPSEPNPRLQRIFQLGNLIEDEVARLFRRIPEVQLHTETPEGEQYNFKYLGGHFAGSMDGAVLGVPEAPNTWHVWEVKSAKDDKFKELLKSDYSTWNEAYGGQLQCYMGASGMPRAITTVYNKDTSELYVERVKQKPGVWENFQIEADTLLNATEPPESPYKPTDYRIKNYKPDYWQRAYWAEDLPSPNCRNCKWSQIKMDGDARWMCNRWRKDLTIDEQKAGCELHLYMPCFMPAKLIEDHGTVMRYQTTDKIEFWNSEDASTATHDRVFSSAELCFLSHGNAIDGQVLTDVARIKQAVGGEVVNS